MNSEHVKLVEEGAEATRQWQLNQYFDYKKLDLSGADLRRVKLSGAYLAGADFTNARLDFADLEYADLTNANFTNANLDLAFLKSANFAGANLSGANLSGAEFCWALIDSCRLANASFVGADLTWASLRNLELATVDFKDAGFRCTSFANCNLSNARNLHWTRHVGPSSISIDTIVRSEGRIPEGFLRACGVSPWLIHVSKLCDPHLHANDISNLISTSLFDARTSGKAFFGGLFISYSSIDVNFVKKLTRKLEAGGAAVWLDIHDMLPGSVEKQITKEIRAHDTVLLVLSKDSLLSDWVWREIHEARKKEKDEGRDVLCPIALDDSWEHPDKYDKSVQYAVKTHQVELGFLDRNHILDFSNSRKFNSQFDRLVRGLKINYNEPKQ